MSQLYAQLKLQFDAHRDVVLRVGGLVLLTVVVFGLHRWLKRLFRKLGERIASEEGRSIQELRVQSVSLVPAQAMVKLLQMAARGLFLALSLLLAYVYVAVVCVHFPATQHLALLLGSWLKRGVSTSWYQFLGYLPNLLTILITLMAIRYLLRLSGLLLDSIGSGALRVPGFDPEWTETTRYLARFFLILLGAVIIAPLLPGAASPAFKGLSVFVGILVSVGSGGAMSNVVSGIFLTYSSSFRVGDVVSVGGVQGTLVAKNLLVVRMRTFKNEEVTIPNSEVMSARIMNFSTAAREHRLIVHTSVTLGYDAPWREVHRLLLEAARKTEGISPEPEPFVLQTSLDGSWITYQINAYTALAERLPGVYSDLHAQIQDAFNEAGLELMTSSFHSLRDGNTSTVPASYFPEGVPTSAFRMAPSPR